MNAIEIAFMILFALLPRDTWRMTQATALAAENAGIILTTEDLQALHGYVSSALGDGDCQNDWLTHMGSPLRDVARGYMQYRHLCDRPVEAEWLGEDEGDPTGYTVTDTGGKAGYLICYHQYHWCIRGDE